MYFIYTLALTLLLVILLLLLVEEKRFSKSITHGLASKFWLLRERRRFVRFDEDIKIRYNLAKKPSPPLNSKTLNISRTGLSIVTYERLDKKTNIDMELEVPGFSRPVRAMGQVMWTKELPNMDEKGRRLFYAGVRFYNINPEHEAILLTHLNSLK